MARATLRTHRAMMNVIGFMAAGTVLGQLGSADGAGMTGVTIDLLVLALQGPMRLLLVVVTSILPLLFGMALLAVIAKPTAMTIIGCVAT